MYNITIMKKILLALILISFLVVPVVGLASGSIEIRPPIGAKTFHDLINNIIDFIFTIALFIAPAMIIVGAFYFLIPSEKSENIETGKKIITYTIIGFIIIMMATGIVDLLRHVFEVEVR